MSNRKMKRRHQLLNCLGKNSAADSKLLCPILVAGPPLALGSPKWLLCRQVLTLFLCKGLRCSVSNLSAFTFPEHSYSLDNKERGPFKEEVS